MVLPGVPKPNGLLHTGEVVSMALDLAAVSFEIPHKPNVQLKICAGIHSAVTSYNSSPSAVREIIRFYQLKECLFGITCRRKCGDPTRSKNSSKWTLSWTTYRLKKSNNLFCSTNHRILRQL
uniref:receptor-type guanylate cyclase gcy-15-like isoform X2 n=1 Tax=Halichoerus grypus TaxID=9711 RepID=UPI001658E381|nr:receptor-type guanylate cyclase gcy-15-like isoform X2 [Halichoerus grypus]